MKDIDKKQYSARKEYEYDDTAILFYKGTKVTKQDAENFRKSWMEEMSYFDNMYDFLKDVVGSYDIELDEADIEDDWEHIWDELEWNKETKSYKYKNWEWIVLDI